MSNSGKTSTQARPLLLVAVIVLTAAAATFLYTRRAHALTERDTVVLADFSNSTGDAVFDDTLKQGLAVQLAQSPFLNILSDQKVRDTLKLMGDLPGSGSRRTLLVTSANGREARRT